MSSHYDTPGVYIEELTGPGVIAGVSTSVAAFVGPARRGPLNEPRRISSFDDFLRLYATEEPDGSFWPYIASPRWSYTAIAVRGFFENGGRQAYFVRVGTAQAATWEVRNQAGQPQPVFRIRARQEGAAGNQLALQIQAASATGSAGVAAAQAQSAIQSVNGLGVVIQSAANFRPGDIVTVNQNDRASVERIEASSNTVVLSRSIAGLAANATLRIANLRTDQRTLRLSDITGLWPGSVVQLQGTNATTNAADTAYAVVESVVRDPGIVTFAESPSRSAVFSLAQPLALVSQEFRLIVTPAGGSAETFDMRSLHPDHPNYIFGPLASGLIEIVPPAQPPTTATYPGALASTGNAPAQLVQGQDDDPNNLVTTHFERGLDQLRQIDGVNLVCIPDAAGNSEQKQIQQKLIEHCLALGDRFAILDAPPGAPVSGPGSVEEYRGAVSAARGFAALYYPWLQVRRPSRGPAGRQAPPPLLVPPSGHLAGVYARTDAERGVHKAPANTEVRAALGLERILSDGQQGPLNEAGVNVLRIFPGMGQVIVWGARTTVDPNVTDWVYVNIRRLMLFIEESIQEGIRWAVFEPNNLRLWQKLRHTITEFLTRVWRAGALFGATPEEAFFVRIDEALNPEPTRALGRLYIEIGVRPSFPAEFIIVRIALWQGQTQLLEG